MFSRQLTDSIRVSLAIPQFAEELFALTDKNRSFLEQWLPWLDATKSVDDSRAFLKGQLDSFAKGKSVSLAIFYNSVLVGMAGFNTIDRANGIGAIGYWLSESHNGKGIMTTVVRDLIELGQENYGLQRIVIRAATENVRSRAVPERLGFELEGTLRRTEKIGDRWYDHAVYGLLL